MTGQLTDDDTHKPQIIMQYNVTKDLVARFRKFLIYMLQQWSMAAFLQYRRSPTYATVPYHMVLLNLTIWTIRYDACNQSGYKHHVQCMVKGL
jgi:hypothetical protein